MCLNSGTPQKLTIRTENDGTVTVHVKSLNDAISVLVPLILSGQALSTESHLTGMSSPPSPSATNHGSEPTGTSSTPPNTNSAPTTPATPSTSTTTDPNYHDDDIALYITDEGTVICYDMTCTCDQFVYNEYGRRITLTALIEQIRAHYTENHP